MKTFLRSLTMLGVFAVCGGVLVGCGSGQLKQTYNEDADIDGAVANLQSDDKDIRVSACIAISEAGPYGEAAVPALIEALNDPEPLVQSLAAYALMEIGEAAKPAIPALLAKMDQPHPEVTPSVINAIRAIDPSAAPGIQVQNVETPPEP